MKTLRNNLLRAAALAVLALLLVMPAGAPAWWTPIGSAHRVIAEAALSNAHCREFIDYLGLNPAAIAAYSQDQEPWWGDSQTHTSYWRVITPNGDGYRYTNDMGYVGESHNRDGGDWPGEYDRSVDVIGTVLHSAADCAVIMGHSPGNDWYVNSAYEAVFEGGGNNRSDTTWDSPTLPFNEGAWERYVYTGEPVSEAHRLYLDTHANFVWWDANVPELQKMMGGTLLDDAAERAVKTGKRWTEAVLVDFLSSWVLVSPPEATLVCNELPNPERIVNSGAFVTFHYEVSGDRQATDIIAGGETVSLGPADPFSLESSGDSPEVALDDVGAMRVELVASHNFFDLDVRVTSGVDFTVVQAPMAALRTDADDADGNTIPDYDLLTEEAPVIFEESTGEIGQRVVEILDRDDEVVAAFEDLTEIPWEIEEVGLYRIRTTVSNTIYGPNTDSAEIELEVVVGLPDEAAPEETIPEGMDGPDAPADAVEPPLPEPHEDAADEAGESSGSGGCGCFMAGTH